MSGPRISIVGAGPGDPDLITVKGLKALQRADAVLYDALANPILLDHAPPQALVKFVGKRAGEHSFQQEDIHTLMVELAQQYGHVVRLKGGDPFVFGRGYEELAYCAASNIPVLVIPGISSAVAVPASQNIPVTLRGIAESFWVVTATTKDDRLSEDLALAIQSSATVVILMGLRKLSFIVQQYKQAGQGALPIMVVQNGTLPNAAVAVSTIDDIQQEVAQKSMGTPAIIVVGHTVGLHPNIVT